MNAPLDPKEKSFRTGLLLALIAPVVFTAVPFIVAQLLVGAPDPHHHAIGGGWAVTYGFALIIGLPLLQGAAMGYYLSGQKLRFFSRAMLFMMLFVVDATLATFVLHEGVICLIISMPLFATIYSGSWVVADFSAEQAAKKRAPLVLLPLIALLSAGEGTAPPPEYASAISDAVTIQASPEQVWRYISQYPLNTNEPEYWLWNVGLPHPTQSVVEGEPKVGAVRECRFTNGVVYKEQITEFVPNKVMTFNVTEQPNHPEALGHFNLDKGQLYLEANPDGSTTVIATSWYRLFVRPAFYYDWWMTDITRQVHFRVLNQMKRLAEADAKRASAEPQSSVPHV